MKYINLINSLLFKLTIFFKKKGNHFNTLISKELRNFAGVAPTLVA
jgi:hypothetical protein